MISDGRFRPLHWLKAATQGSRDPPSANPPRGSLTGGFCDLWVRSARAWPAVGSVGARFSRLQRSYLGINTVSITWMTPFEAMMSVWVTLAPSIFTPSFVEMVALWPWTVFTRLIFTTSAARTLPATT